jgi:hypothetical protein
MPDISHRKGDIAIPEIVIIYCQFVFGLPQAADRGGTSEGEKREDVTEADQLCEGIAVAA